MSDSMISEEFARSIKYWRWCWNCGTRGMDCPVAGRPEGGDPRCCPDCWHSDYAPVEPELAEATIGRLTEEKGNFRRALVAEGARRMAIVEAATALVEEFLGMNDYDMVALRNADGGRISDRLAALVAAVEEGDKS